MTDHSSVFSKLPGATDQEYLTNEAVLDVLAQPLTSQISSSAMIDTALATYHPTFADKYPTDFLPDPWQDDFKLRGRGFQIFGRRNGAIRAERAQTVSAEIVVFQPYLLVPRVLMAPGSYRDAKNEVLNAISTPSGLSSLFTTLWTKKEARTLPSMVPAHTDTAALQLITKLGKRELVPLDVVALLRNSLALGVQAIDVDIYNATAPANPLAFLPGPAIIGRIQNYCREDLFRLQLDQVNFIHVYAPMDMPIQIARVLGYCLLDTHLTGVAAPVTAGRNVAISHHVLRQGTYPLFGAGGGLVQNRRIRIWTNSAAGGYHAPTIPPAAAPAGTAIDLVAPIAAETTIDNFTAVTEILCTQFGAWPQVGLALLIVALEYSGHRHPTFRGPPYIVTSDNIRPGYNTSGHRMRAPDVDMGVVGAMHCAVGTTDPVFEPPIWWNTWKGFGPRNKLNFLYHLASAMDWAATTTIHLTGVTNTILSLVDSPMPRPFPFSQAGYKLVNELSDVQNPAPYTREIMHVLAIKYTNTFMNIHYSTEFLWNSGLNGAREDNYHRHPAAANPHGIRYGITYPFVSGLMKMRPISSLMPVMGYGYNISNFKYGEQPPTDVDGSSLRLPKSRKALPAANLIRSDVLMLPMLLFHLVDTAQNPIDFRAVYPDPSRREAGQNPNIVIPLPQVAPGLVGPPPNFDGDIMTEGSIPIWDAANSHLFRCHVQYDAANIRWARIQDVLGDEGDYNRLKDFDIAMSRVESGTHLAEDDEAGDGLTGGLAAWKESH